VEALVTATGGQEISVYATDPLDRRVAAVFGVFDNADGVKTAVIEMAAASGLALTAGANRPLEASTFGTGELIKAALDERCGCVIIGIGGSATTDGGTGMATALGARFYDVDGDPVPPGGGRLARLDKIDVAGLDPRLALTEILVAGDVDNPLFGPDGAAYVYGLQKGADAAQVKVLDDGLQRLAEVIKRDLGVDVASMPGAGAAGGLGAGLVAFAGASIRSGVELISEAVGLPNRLAGADLAITGEGRIDSQTMRGKVPIGVAKQAKAAGVPVVAIVGSMGPGAEEAYKYGIKEIVSISEGLVTAEEAMKNAAVLLEAAAERSIKRGLSQRPKQR